jgi:glycosyltransferase involved in cell wall biosynthesis
METVTAQSAMMGVQNGLRLTAKFMLSATLPQGQKTISAMIRIRNEEEFLESAVVSIIDIFDEVILIDNLSDDTTPAIISDLSSRFPKVKAYRYEHQIARAGRENVELAKAPGEKRSPRLLANYYNWCLAKCTMKYTVKWDADMIATPELASAVEKFQQSPAQVMCISGANVHPNRTHYINTDGFYSSIEDYEPRLFVRRFARYVDDGRKYEVFRSPYQGRHWWSTYKPLVFLHMKYCKVSPEGNWSDAERPVIGIGAELEPELLAIAKSLV